MNYLKTYDEEIFNLLKLEEDRQEYNIELIASENYVSKSILQANGCVLTNRYSEGYPNRRYYGGCEHVDKIEQLAIDRAKELFKTDYHVNVQPHSGSQANMGAYMSILEQGDTVLGMDLSNGGHLTHGSAVNFSGRLYDFKHYGISEDGLIDYNEVLKIAKEVKPKLIVCGASCYSRTIDFEKFRNIADEVGAYLMADISHIAGLVATGLHPTPFGLADFVTTTTHKTLRGTRGGVIFCKQEFAKKVDSAIFPRIQGGALQHIILAKAVGFKEAMQQEFKDYIQQVVRNAKVMAEEFMTRGYDVVSNGTDNHMFLIDLTNKGISGKDAQIVLDEVGITVNKNTVPNETKSPFVTSGIRIGTSAITTRGMREEEVIVIVDLIDKVLQNPNDEQLKCYAKAIVKSLSKLFELYK